MPPHNPLSPLACYPTSMMACIVNGSCYPKVYESCHSAAIDCDKTTTDVPILLLDIVGFATEENNDAANARFDESSTFLRAIYRLCQIIYQWYCNHLLNWKCGGYRSLKRVVEVPERGQTRQHLIHQR